MDIDKPTHMDAQHCIGHDGTRTIKADDNVQSMDVELGSLCSTKPQKTTAVRNNKLQKQLGANKAKNLKLDERSEITLSPEDATMYRALAAKCNYLVQGEDVHECS